MSRWLPLALLTATLSVACVNPAPAAHPPGSPGADTHERGPSVPIPTAEGPSAPAPSADPLRHDPPLVAIPDGIDCDRRIDFQRCPEGGDDCRAHQMKVNHYLGRWRVACEPLVPADPIAGERVLAAVAGKPESLPLVRDETVCRDPKRNGTPVVTQTQEGAVTVFHTFSPRTAACRGGSDAYIVELGVLDAGEYEVRSDYGRHRFTVRPQGADPGPFDPDFVIKARVAAARRIGECAGMPPCMAGGGLDEFLVHRASSRMARLFPTETPEERYRIYRTARGVVLTPAGRDRWTYEYRSLDGCSSTLFRGEARQRPGDALVLGDAKEVSTELIPC